MSQPARGVHGGAGRPSMDRMTVRTICGRELTVAVLRLNGLPRPVGRVTLDIDCQDYDLGRVWASLTPGEARQLAQLLLARAIAVERDDTRTG